MFEKYCGLEKVVDGHRYAIETQRVEISRDLLGRVAAGVEDLLDLSGTMDIVCDRTTWEIAGEKVAHGFLDRGHVVDKLLVIEPADAHAVADIPNVEHVREAIVAEGYTAVVAVGAGTVNDIAKMASFRAGKPYAVVGTAPSMNGYTSAIAALLEDGVKTTQPCQAPIAVFCDVDVMAESPYRMIVSGLGDLLSKPVSNADWRLGARLAGAFYSSFPMEMIDAAHAALKGVPAALPSRDRDAAAGLSTALCLSGMAMASIGTSSPASGGEHLISHYLDMVAIAQGKEHDFHGCQVGVGTITTAAIYERFCAIDPIAIDVERLVARHVPWTAYERTLRTRFDPYNLTDAVLEHARKGYPDRNVLRERLHSVKRDWAELIAEVSATLQPSREIQQLLIDAGAPHTYADLDVTPKMARQTVLWCKDIRARYTILDLASELGQLETWTDEVLDPSVGILRGPEG